MDLCLSVLSTNRVDASVANRNIKFGESEGNSALSSHAQCEAMVAEGIPFGVRGRNYRELFFAIYSGAALYIACVALTLWTVLLIILHRRHKANAAVLEGDGLLGQLQDSVDAEDGSSTSGGGSARSKAGKQGERPCLVRVALLSAFVVLFCVYFLIIMLCLDNNPWWGLMSIVACAALAAGCMVACRPRWGLSRGVMRGLPWVAAFYLTVAAVQLAAWNMASGAVAAVLAAIPVWAATLHLLCVMTLAQDMATFRTLHRVWHMKDNRTHRRYWQRCADVLRLTFTRHSGLMALSMLLEGALCAIVVMAMTSTCVAFYNPLVAPVPTGGTTTISPVMFSTWLSRLALPPSCPEAGGKPCHVYLTVRARVWCACGARLWWDAVG